MRLASVELWCRDLDASLRFYGDVLGMDLTYSDPHPPDDVEHHETMFGSPEEGGATYFLLFPAGKRPASTGASLTLVVQDIEQVYARATAAGVEVVDHLVALPSGGRTARFRDPDGNVISVVGR